MLKFDELTQSELVPGTSFLDYFRDRLSRYEITLVYDWSDMGPGDYRYVQGIIRRIDGTPEGYAFSFEFADGTYKDMTWRIFRTD